MPDVQRPLNPTQDILTALDEKAKETEQDSFWIRVTRKITMTPQVLGIFDDCTLQQCARPEEWVPQLFGGGSYLIACGHSSDTIRQIGASMQVNFPGAPIEKPDFGIVDSDGWLGPKKFRGQPAAGARVITYGEMPSRAAPPPPTSAPATDPTLHLLLEQMNRMQYDMSQRFERLLEARREPPAPKSPISPELIGALGPIVMKMMDNSAETQRVQMQLSQKQSEETRAMIAAMNESSQRETKALLASLKPQGIDPTIQKVLDKYERMVERASGGGEGPDQVGEMLGQMTAAMGQVMSLSQKAIALAAESQMEGGGSGIKEGIREALKMFEGLGQMYFQSKMRPAGAKRPLPPQPQQALPPQQAPQQTPPAPVPPKATGPTSVDRLKEAIFAHHDPDEVARGIVLLLENDDAAFLAGIQEAGGDFGQFVAKHFNVPVNGQIWALEPKNRLYLQTLGELFFKHAVDAGVLQVGEAPADEEEGADGAPE